MDRLFDLAAYLKSAEGEARLQEQVPFIANGIIIQGFNQVPFPTEESQVTDEELRSYDDLDNTKDQVWFRRKQRLESKIYRKNQEYDKRRAELRRIRNEIRASIKQDKELGIEPNPADTAEIAAIDKRMSKLVQLTTSFEAPPEAVEAEEPKAEPDRVQCGECGEMSREGHPHPDRWLKGHKMGKHSKGKRIAS